MLEKVFIKLNLDEKHTRVYLTLFEESVSTAGKLSKKLSIPRSTLYGLLYDLNKKGLVIQSEKQGIKVWQAESPDKLKHLINNEINNLEDLNLNLSTLITELKNKEKQDFVSPKFSYFEGPDALRQMLKDVLCYRNIDTIAFWPISEMIKILGKDFFIYSNKERIKRNISAKVLWPNDRQVDLKDNVFLGVGNDFKREIRIAPKNIDCSMGYWAYENKAAFLSSKKESFGFIVESVELKQLLETQFNVLWELSKSIKPQKAHTQKFINELNL